jgi:hypothetical protein
MPPARTRALVRDLYRRLLLVGRDYPRGLAFVRARAKAAAGGGGCSGGGLH